MPSTKTCQVRNALLYDGSGCAPYAADVVIGDGKVEDILSGGAAMQAETELDAGGLALAPGFVDIHSHSDGALAHPAAAEILEPFLLQGITTQVIGNCGLGLAPAPVDHRDVLGAFMALVIPDGMPWNWESFSDYLDYLDDQPLPLNVASLAAHGSLRCAVAGAEPGPARGEVLAAIGSALHDALEAGAYGLSAGLIYPPGMWADTEELVTLCREVAARDGVFACHVRGSSELAIEAERELLEIGTRTGVRLQHSHHEAFGPGYWDQARTTLAMEDEARAAGLDIASDVVPYHAVNTSLLAIFPPWALAGGVAALCSRLGQPEVRQRIDAEIRDRAPQWPPWDDGWAHNLVRAGGWDAIVPLHANSDVHEPWLGRSLAETAAAEGRTAFDCAAELVTSSAGDVMARYHGITGAPGDDGVLRDLLTHEHHAIGVDVILKGTGVPHPGGFGAMPRVLGHYSRDAGWMGTAAAVRKITAQPAERLRLRRGTIAVGEAADLVLFDPQAIGERGSYADPTQRPRGVEHVFLNGTHVVAHGELRERGAGRVLRRGRD